MEDYLNKINALVAEAMEAAREEGKAEAAAECRAEIEKARAEAAAEYEAKLEKAREAAYEAGRQAALKEVAEKPAEPSEPEEPKPMEPEVPEAVLPEVVARESEISIFIKPEDFDGMEDVKGLKGVLI